MQWRFAENAIEAQAIRGQANELYEQLLKASTVIIEMTGMLLPMFDRALFSDATYAAIVKASENIAAMRFRMPKLDMYVDAQTSLLVTTYGMNLPNMVWGKFPTSTVIRMCFTAGTFMTMWTQIAVDSQIT